MRSCSFHKLEGMTDLDQIFKIKSSVDQGSKPFSVITGSAFAPLCDTRPANGNRNNWKNQMLLTMNMDDSLFYLQQRFDVFIKIQCKCFSSLILSIFHGPLLMMNNAQDVFNSFGVVGIE